MESKLSPDKEKAIPPVPIKTYQWEDLRRARDAGGYPWTHLLKTPLEGEITAEDIIRETTPRRSMSREFSRSRSRSSASFDVQRILDLDSSPGSSRKNTKDGEDEQVNIPKFSKEVSCESEEDVLSDAVKTFVAHSLESQTSSHLSASTEAPKNISPKSILKHRTTEQHYTVTETREKTKCCHPLVNKIKHLADKTLQKLEGNDNEKSTRHKKHEEVQEIRQLTSSPGAVRRQKFSAIKMGDSDEMSKKDNTPSPRKKKEHIYEDIEDKRNKTDRLAQHYDETLGIEYDNKSISDKEGANSSEKKSIASQDPSLVVEDASSLKNSEHVMEQLYQVRATSDKAIISDDEMDLSGEFSQDDIIQNQSEKSKLKKDTPNVTITEIVDGYLQTNEEEAIIIPIETSPTPSVQEIERKRTESEAEDKGWSKPNSDHEYEIIEKPTHNVYHGKYTSSLVDKTERDETSSNEPDQISNDAEDIINAEALQRDIEERFLNTPSTISRTECEISTSQVDSSALEHLPLKRNSRLKNGDNIETKIQQRLKEGTGKLKEQAGKLKARLQNMKTNMPDKPKINFPAQSKFKFPDRPKFTMPERPKFTLPDKRKFSLPDRSKFRNINISDNLTFGGRNKFSLRERPKFNVPDLSKFKMPERPKLNFPSMSRKKHGASISTVKQGTATEFEAKTYPRLFNRKKKSEFSKTSSFPTLNSENTPAPSCEFERVKNKNIASHFPKNPEHPREYGNIDNQINSKEYLEGGRQLGVKCYDADNFKARGVVSNSNISENPNIVPAPDVSPTNEKYSHINEINNDEFFVRPRGISRENIQVREYLSNEIRQAFKIPENFLATMGSTSGNNDDSTFINEAEADPELIDAVRCSTEDLSDKDDGYYTFPPKRPARSKRKDKYSEPSIKYIDDNINTSLYFSEVDLELIDEQYYCGENIEDNLQKEEVHVQQLNLSPSVDLNSFDRYENQNILEYTTNISMQPQTLPMPPKRKKKANRERLMHSSLSDFKHSFSGFNQAEDTIGCHTEYIVPHSDATATENSPLPPGRNRSRSSRGTSLCDDDRTSRGAESLALDTHIQTEEVYRVCRESPGYATVNKVVKISSSKTSPVRRRKSNSSDRKYHCVESAKPMIPDRPSRKNSSSSRVTLDKKLSVSADLTQYVEIDEVHKDLSSGLVLSKMKDRPLPPPPRPPRGPKRDKHKQNDQRESVSQLVKEERDNYGLDVRETENMIDIEVSTQTDPLPDDVDFELDLEENNDSITSSLRDVVDEDSILSQGRLFHSVTRSDKSRSDKSFKTTNPKIAEIVKSRVGSTSPTVILIERRVSSPTRIKERKEILIEASLTAEHIDVDESQISNIPLLPERKSTSGDVKKSECSKLSSEDRAVEKTSSTNMDAQLNNSFIHQRQVLNSHESELQPSNVSISEKDGMTSQVNETDIKLGTEEQKPVTGIEISQTVIDEIVKKFSEITTNHAFTAQAQEVLYHPRPMSREEQTQTDILCEFQAAEMSSPSEATSSFLPPRSEETCELQHELRETPPERPPPPDLTPLLYSYLHDIMMPQASLYTSRPLRERTFSEFNESQHHSPPTINKRMKRKPATPHSESSSEQERPRPTSRRVKAHELTIAEAGANFLRVCQNSVSRALRNMFNSFMSYISGTDDKKDVQMALVIFLVLIAGLIMFGLSDSRTIHHHHWEFFNPPDSKK